MIKPSPQHYEHECNRNPKDDRSSNSSKGQSSSLKANSKSISRSSTKNPYLKILDQLPQEIKDKIDRSKENLDDM